MGLDETAKGSEDRFYIVHHSDIDFSEFDWMLERIAEKGERVVRTEFILFP